LVGDDAAVGDGGQACTLAPAQPTIDPVTMQIGGAAPDPGREAVGEHLHHLVEGGAGEFPIGPGPAQALEQSLLVPVLGGDFGDDLLGQHIQGLVGNPDAVEPARPRRREQGGALGQVVTGQGKQPALGGSRQGMTGAADPLQQGGDGPW